ncbi:MAG: substrate-binding domain-containing protein [Endozoicomonas sp.]
MLASQYKKHIGLVISGPGYGYLTNPYIYKLVNGINSALDGAGYELTLRMATTENELMFIKGELNSNLYDGLLIWGTRMADESFVDLFNHSKPVVSIARGHEDEKVNFISVEHYQAAYSMTEFLLNKGHRKIMFLGRLDHVKAAHERFCGYKQALIDNGVAFQDEWALAADYYLEESYQLIDGMSSVEFDAIFAGSDLMAMGAMKALLKKGFSIPGDIAIAGFDNIPNSDMLPVALTTVDTPIYELGENAATMLISLIKSESVKTKREMTTSIIERQSA